MSHDPIESHLNELRVFPPAAEFSSRATVSSMAEYEKLCAEAKRDPEAFWAERARALDWIQPFSRVLDRGNAPFFRWFTDGKLNLSANCLDRHLAKRGDQPAILWEGEPGEARSLSYRELHREVCQTANALK